VAQDVCSIPCPVFSLIFRNSHSSSVLFFINKIWRRGQIALRIHDALVKHGVQDLWMDVFQMSKNTLECMAEAVERSHVVLVLFSSGGPRIFYLFIFSLEQRSKQENPRQMVILSQHPFPIFSLSLSLKHIASQWQGGPRRNTRIS
jgi:hypothetical protein